MQIKRLIVSTSLPLERIPKTGFHPGSSPGQAFSDRKLFLFARLIRKPVPIPDQVRDRLFRIAR